jgi:serine/threonine protein kinase
LIQTSMDKHRNSLQPGYKLHWYHIIKILGQGGFGITYLAHDTNLDQQVAIKEYLPTDLAVRENDISVHPVSEGHRESYEWGLEKFISEARTLAKFKHHNIVRVLSVFTENNTAYMVMEYEHGEPMDALLKNKKTIEEGKLKSILMPMLDGLEQIHKEGFIHRDIKPPNIYIRMDGSPVLLDFGSARQSLGIQTQTLTTMVSPGYAPFEQYTSKSDKQGPWTDIYGLGATLYRAVTGIGPTDAMDRSEALLHTNKDVYVPASRIAGDNYSEEFLAAIDHALLFKTDERPQSIDEWREELDGGIAVKYTASEAETVAISPVDVVDSVQVTDEKTILLDAEEKSGEEPEYESREETKKKPRSLLGKLIKWVAILFAILLALAILSDEEKKKTSVETATTDSQASDPLEEPFASDVAGNVPGETDKDISDVQSELQIINDLLDGARLNIKELKLTSPLGNNAYEKYQTVLNIDSKNPEALNGLDRIVDEYIDLMDFALEKNDIPRARNYLRKGMNINSDHYGVADAERRLNTAGDAREAKVREDKLREQEARGKEAREQELMKQEELRQQEQIKKEQQSLILNTDKQKLEQLKRKLRANPKDKRARKELKKIADKYQNKIKVALEDRDFDLAEDYVLDILEITPERSKGYKDLTETLGKIRAMKYEVNKQ